MIVGSVREVINIQDAAPGRAQVIAVRRQLVDDLVGFWYAGPTVRGFEADGQKALAKTKELQEQVWGVGHAQGVGPMLQIFPGLERL